jgi:PAS domain S-box-containing protein
MLIVLIPALFFHTNYLTVALILLGIGLTAIILERVRRIAAGAIFLIVSEHVVDIYASIVEKSAYVLCLMPLLLISAVFLIPPRYIKHFFFADCIVIFVLLLTGILTLQQTFASPSNIALVNNVTVLVPLLLVGFVIAEILIRVVVASLQQNEEKFSAIFSLVPVAISIATAPEGAMVDVNEAWLELLGFASKDEVFGKTSVDLGLIPAPDQRENIMKQIQENGYVRNAEVDFLTRTGKLGTVIVNNKMITMGNKNYNLTTNYDVTELKRAEVNLRDLNQELETSNKDLEAFTHAASHDLQAPLRTISGFLSLIQRRYGSQLGDRGVGLIERCVAAVGRLTQLVQDLLTFSRAASRELDMKETDLGQLVTEVVADLQADVQESGASVTIGQLPAISIDRTQVRQVFHNLIHNAIKFHRAGVAPEVQVTAAGDNGEWTFAVSDNGIGIDPELGGKIFQPFKRLHAEDEYPGTGIGLSIARRVVERHGGRIWVESAPGEGSTFYFTLPQ